MAMTTQGIKIDKTKAEQLLVTTAHHNLTGRIGSAYAVNGYSPEDAMALVKRSSERRMRDVNGVITLYVLVDGFGWHSFYIVVEPPPVDPWSR